MFKTNEDCFYFLTSTCAKVFHHFGIIHSKKKLTQNIFVYGPSCPYRHSPVALACNVICQKWKQGNCPTPTCPFRHSNTIPV